MSYCVNCGVELDKTASVCPLCHTPVVNPNQPVDTTSPGIFPSERGEVAPVSKRELALLLTVMLASVSVCCGVLNLFLAHETLWSLYIAGAAMMLWVWLVLPLLIRTLSLYLRLVLDGGAVGVYVLLIALALGGMDWYLALALPIVLLGTAGALFLALTISGGRRSILSSVTLIIGTVGVFLIGVELFVDWFRFGRWTPGWSLVVFVICGALIVPLVVVRRVPSLREEARRRFHM